MCVCVRDFVCVCVLCERDCVCVCVWVCGQGESVCV